MTEAPSSPSPFRYILDTNILIAAAFKPSSASGCLVAAVRDGRAVLVWNESTRREAEKLLRRIPFTGWTPVAGLFSSAGRIDAPTNPDAFPQVPDRDDRKFAALAMVAGCVLVSNDSDFLNVRDALPFPVLTPSQAVRHLPEE